MNSPFIKPNMVILKAIFNTDKTYSYHNCNKMKRVILARNMLLPYAGFVLFYFLLIENSDISESRLGFCPKTQIYQKEILAFS